MIGGSSVVAARDKDVRAQIADVVTGDDWVAAENVPLPPTVQSTAEGYEHSKFKVSSRILAYSACEPACSQVRPSPLSRNNKPEQILEILKSLRVVRCGS
jgi:hypothetical protein